MAIDEAILEAAGRGEVPPTLRLYAWDPLCLSIGYAQGISDVDLGNLEAHGWDLVRRPTGGRAILHSDELTYSVMGPYSEPRLSGSVMDSYSLLSRALLECLFRLEVPAVADPDPSSPQTSHGKAEPVCFEVPSRYEITVAGKKLIGSAQSRKKVGVLQHGTIPLYGDLRRIVQALAYSDEDSRRTAGERLLQRATTLETVLGWVVSWDTAAGTLAGAFSHILNLKLIPTELTPAETARAEELVRVKYGNNQWTERV
jgi:lipoate-protein ligase A